MVSVQVWLDPLLWSWGKAYHNEERAMLKENCPPPGDRKQRKRKRGRGKIYPSKTPFRDLLPPTRSHFPQFHNLLILYLDI
jgi:hypothetical protein